MNTRVNIQHCPNCHKSARCPALELSSYPSQLLIRCVSCGEPMGFVEKPRSPIAEYDACQILFSHQGSAWICGLGRCPIRLGKFRLLGDGQQPLLELENHHLFIHVPILTPCVFPGNLMAIAQFTQIRHVKAGD